MTNSITKNTAIDYTSARLGVPGKPPLPLRQWYSNEPRSQFVLSGAGVTYGWIQQPPVTPTGPYPDAQLTPSVPALTGLVPGATLPLYAWRTQQVDRPVTTNVQNAVPPSGRVVPSSAQVYADFNLGWNAGIRSQQSMLGNASISFVVQQSVGIVAGLNQVESKGRYFNIGWGFSFAGPNAFVMENGFQKLAVVPYNRVTDVFTITRIGTTVYYLKNGTIYYVSTVPCNGTVFFDVSMYAGGDTIDSPVFTVPNACVAIARPMRSVGGLVTYRFATSTTQPMTSNSGVKTRAVTATGPYMTSQSSNKPYLASKAVMKTMTVSAVAGPVSSSAGVALSAYGLVNSAMTQLTQGATCLTGQIGGTGILGVPMQTLRTFSGNGVKSSVKASAAPATATCLALDGPLVARMGGLNYAHDAIACPTFFVLSMNSNGLFTSSASYLVQLPASMSSLLTTQSSASVASTLLALMRSTLLAGFTTPVINDLNQVWVINTENNAVSTYEAFPFNSFARIGNRYYGTKTDGVYLLEGSNDQGAAVHASLSFGRMNFDTLGMKSVPTMYIGVSSTGVMVLKVTTPQGEFLYTARSFDPNMKTQRIDVGKGLRANYYQLELFNQAGADFSLDDIEFRIVTSDTRRIA